MIQSSGETKSAIHRSLVALVVAAFGVLTSANGSELLAVMDKDMPISLVSSVDR